MRNKKPSFRVKHPYQNLINSILMGLILLLSSVLSVVIINNTFNNNVGSTHAADAYSWYDVDYYMKNGYTVYLRQDITISSSYTALSSTWTGKLYGEGKKISSYSGSSNGYVHITLNPGALVDNVVFYGAGGSTSTSSYAKFFRQVSSGATISNCTFTHTSASYDKPMIYYNYGTISRCVVNGSGSVWPASSGVYWGTLCTYNYGTVTQCSNSTNVVGTNVYFDWSTKYVSGLVGYNYGYGSYAGLISQCYNSGTINGTPGSSSNKAGGHAAGICGYNSYGDIVDCYNTGTIYGGDSYGGVNDTAGVNGGAAAGIVVYSFGSSSYYASVKNCYNIGSITGGDGGNGGNCTTVSSGGNGGSAGSSQAGWPYWCYRWGKYGTGGNGGYGGYGGGQGGSVGGTILFSNSYATYSGLLGFTAVTSGSGGRGGLGAGGGGGGGGGGGSRGGAGGR